MRFAHVLVTVTVLLYFVPFSLAQHVTILEHGGAVQSVAFSPVDNSLIASAGGHNTIKLWSPRAVHPEGVRLRFKITDLDGLHQAQLFATVEYLNGHDLSILDCKFLDGSSNVVEFITTSLTLTADSEPLQVLTDSVTLRVIDVYGNFTHKEFPIDITRLQPSDINVDGTVNIQDLVLVASNFGQQGESRADVNGDGAVNIQDLVLVAGVFGNPAAAQ